MSETSSQQPDMQKPVETDWGQVTDTIEQIGLSPDVQARTSDVANFNGVDLAAMTTLIHRDLAPTADQTPVDFAMKLTDPNGDTTAVLMNPEDRFPLFNEGANLIQELGSRVQPGEEEAFLERASNIAALSVVLAHPFEDGNGRTSRTIAYLIREGYDGSEDAQQELKQIGTERPQKGFRMYGFVPMDKELSPSEVLRAAASVDIPLKDVFAYEQEARAKFTSPYEYLADAASRKDKT